ncbi:hypothetical protein GCM10009814_30980 [Lapillicoccus jejuensis]|uniref:Putative serine esterase DUF676 n=1 Tax=Lapillicoccus jejuensis TaxID=402171 RepID=A0A542E221_9MICO|nr:putative serine esterase DUF676 [Lapillicoccus jejuensis]
MDAARADDDAPAAAVDDAGSRVGRPGPVGVAVDGVARAVRAVRTSRTALGEAAGALLTPGGLAGAAVETMWISTHLAIYPLGLVGGRSRGTGPGYRIEHLPPVQRGLHVRDVEAAGTPIVLVHGIVDNRSVFTLLRRGLRGRGFGRVSTMNYSILTGDVRVAAARLAAEVERICEETGYERLHVVGHSMGGLIARYYVTRLGGDARVHTLVTLGSPHAGTWTAYGWPSTLTRQLRPGSPLMRELAGPVAGCRTRFLCYWSDLDQVMFPQRTAALEHPDLDVTNVRLHGVGHTSIPIMDAVVRGISEALAHLDEDGSTVAPAVAPLHAPRSSGRRPGC